MAVKQTAGRDSLGRFAPEFAHLNDDVLPFNLHPLLLTFFPGSGRFTLALRDVEC